MQAPQRRSLRRLRRSLGYGALLALILLATLVGLASQLLPVVERHPEEVARWLSARVGQPIAFDGLEARWSRAGPRFALRRLAIGEGERTLHIERADLQVSIYSGLFPGMPLTELSVDGLTLALHQDAEGRWSLRGLPRAVAAAGGDPFDLLEGFGELRVQDARLRIEAERWGIDHTLPRIDARMRVDGARVRGGARLWSEAGQAPLDLVAELARDGSEGRLWLGSEQVELPAWGPLLAALGVEALEGGGGFGAWARLADRRIVEVQLDARLQALRLRRAGTALPPLRFDRARFDARWQLGGEGWQVSVPAGEFLEGPRRQRVEDFWMAGGESLAIEAGRIDMGPLLALAALSNRLPDGLAAWLAEARPEGTVLGLEVPLAPAGEARGSALLREVGFAPVGRRPGLSGLAGRLEFDPQGAVLALEAPALGFDWPPEFGERLPLSLTGELVLWREEENWVLGSEALALRGPGLALQTRFSLALEADGSRPRLDLAAALDEFEVVAAKRYWPRTTMPKPVQRWLDEALVSGRGRHGRVAIGGDLDDWPFRRGEGVFDARVELSELELAFHPGWPAATGLGGEAVFTGPGMVLEGLSGQLLEARVSAASGRIADFREPRLELEIRGGGDAGGLRRLVARSPLYAAHKAHIDAIDLSGAAALDLRLQLPLKAGIGERRVEGVLAIDGTRASDRRWDLTLEGLSGSVPFTERGFLVDALPARIGDAPAVFTLRVGDQVRDAAHQAEVRLEAELRPAQLLERAPGVAWLEPWLGGQSLWDLRLDVPKAAGGRPRLRLGSDLVGTRIGLPAPLRKSAATPLPLRLELPLDAPGGTLDLALGRLMRLRGRLAEGERPFAGVAEFGAVEDAPPALPASGIAVVGRLPSLDVGGWVAAAAGGGEGAGGLASVDVAVGAIDVLDRSFGEGRVRLERGGEALRLAFDGPAIAGEVRVPKAEGGEVQGRFARLHWPPVDARAMTGGEDAAPAVDQTDPTRLPPLRFRIDDFRLGEARLGRAELIAFPTPEGLRVDRFSTESPALTLLARGHWSRIGGQTRSRFNLDFSAPSLGSMLDALGFAGMVEDGPVKARMAGDWPGSPGSFRLDRFDGSLRLDVGKGRLLEVEPGTGRLLGLVSIAEVPRRLSLDFSDFFAKGFAFNAMNGDFSFAGGAATTRNLRIDGPAAEIQVSGTTALGTRQYEQRIEVLPKTGGVLPALGAVTGGPAGAALGAVAQAVFQTPLKQASRTVYAVNGPWAQPEVTVVERGPRRPAEGPEGPPPGAPR